MTKSRCTNCGILMEGPWEDQLCNRCYTEAVPQGVNDERRKKHSGVVGYVDVAGVVRKGPGMELKTKLTIAVVAWSVGFALTAAYGCPKGSSEWRDGVCVVDIKPEGAAVDASKWIVKGDAPKGKMPSYQRENMKVVEIPAFRTEAEENTAQAKYAHEHPAPKYDPTAGKKP